MTNVHLECKMEYHCFCMLFDSYLSFKLAGRYALPEHDKMLGHSC